MLEELGPERRRFHLCRKHTQKWYWIGRPLPAGPPRSTLRFHHLVLPRRRLHPRPLLRPAQRAPPTLVAPSQNNGWCSEGVRPYQSSDASLVQHPVIAVRVHYLTRLVSTNYVFE